MPPTYKFVVKDTGADSTQAIRVLDSYGATPQYQPTVTADGNIEMSGNTLLVNSIDIGSSRYANVGLLKSSINILSNPTTQLEYCIDCNINNSNNRNYVNFHSNEQLYSAGAITGTNDYNVLFNTISDRRIKQDICANGYSTYIIDGSAQTWLQTVNALKPVSFKFQNDVSFS